MTTTIYAVQEAATDKPAALGVITWDDFKNTPITIGAVDGVGSALFKRTVTPANFIAENFKPSVVKVGPKFGPGFVQCYPNADATPRQLPYVGGFWCLSLDIDNGTSWAVAIAAAKRTGLRYIANTTASHLTTSSSFKSTNFKRWCAERKIDPSRDAVQMWLVDDRRWISDAANGVTSFAFVGAVDDRDRPYEKLEIEHAPLPKIRLTFPLDQGFEGATSDWKRAYALLIAVTGLGVDPSLLNPVQPVFFPRLRDAGAEYLFETGGDLVANMEAIIAEAERLGIESPKRASVKRSKGPAKRESVPTPTVEDYRRAEPDKADEIVFQMAWGKFREVVDMPSLAETLGENPRTVYLEDDNGKEFEAIETRCPYRTGWNDLGGHTDGDTEDPNHRPVIWIGARDHEHGTAWASCFHSHCKESIAPWQFAWALVSGLPRDQWANVLVYPEARPDFLLWLADLPKTVAEIAADVSQAIAALVPSGDEDADADKADAVLDLLALMPESTKRDRLLQRLHDKMGGSITTMRAAIKRIEARNKQEALARSGFFDAPDVDEAKPGEVWLNWSHMKQIKAAEKFFVEKNKETPTIFRRPDGGLVLVVNNTSMGTRYDVPDSWGKTIQAILSDEMGMRFLQRNAETGEIEEKMPPGHVIVGIEGRLHKLDIPEIEKVVRVPIFSKDGKLVLEPGYNPHTKAYYDPGDFVAKEVPATVTDADVNKALGILGEALRDFPFSDVFDGVDPEPIRNGSVDGDGDPLPNPDRGPASYANTLALILQPFVRAMIQGPTPQYHIGAPKAGTGKGFIADVAASIWTGTEKAETQSLTSNNDETSKMLTAQLLDASEYLFIDNAQYMVDNPSFASLLTAGTYMDRILGKSLAVRMPVRKTFMIAGNRINFNEDMLRRNVPIYMNANTPNPASDRKADYYKHPNLHKWLKDNRAEMVWACHVLVQNWIQKDCPKPEYAPYMGSFESCRDVLGGILEAAEVWHYLGNLDAYRESEGKGAVTASPLAQRIWDKFGTDLKSASELLEVCKVDGSSGGLGVFGKSELEIDPGLDIPPDVVQGKGAAMKFGKYIDRELRNDTVMVDSDGNGTMIKVMWVKKPYGNNTKYGLERVE